MNTTFTPITDQDIYSEDSVNRAVLGTLGMTADGRCYRYCKNGSTALAVGKLVIAPTGHEVQDNHADIATNTAAIGDTTVTVTLGATAVTANQYTYLVVNDDTGEGYSYLIKSHPASSGSEDITVTLAEPIRIAFGANATATLVASPYDGVVIATGGTQTSVPVGVPNIAVTASYYFWAQTRGVCPVLMAATNNPTKGEPVTLPEATDGAVSGRDAIAEPMVGISLDTSVAGEYNPVNLMID